MSGPSSGALAGLRVLDVSVHPSGQYAARLLADGDATVGLLDDPADARTGSRAHRPGEPTDVDAAVHRHLNAGKVRLRTPPDRDDRPGLVELCAGYDVAVVSDPALADAVAARSAGRTVVALVTEFGRTGPYARWGGSEIVHQALSGSMWMNGLRDRAPLYGCGMRASYAAGTFLYLATVAALHLRLRGGSATTVEVTVHEAAAAMEQNFSSQWHYNRTLPGRDEMVRPKGRARCRDGWAVYFVRHLQWPAFCEVFERPDLECDPRFAAWSDLVRDWRAAEAELSTSVGHLSVATLVERADRHGLVLAPVIEPAQQFDDPHLAARGFWQELTWGDGHGPVRALGPLFRMSATPTRPPRAVRDADPPDPSAEGDHQPWAPLGCDTTAGRPLAGVRVLDLTVAWAGPMAGRLLANLGADVIKLEGPNRLDAWRGEARDPSLTYVYPDGVPGARPYDRSCWFNSQNHDKRCIVVDTKAPAGLAAVRRLAAACDVVLVNYTPGALDRMGLGYRDLVAENPDVIVVEMPAFGAGGPQAQLKGLGPTMEAMAGLAALIGYPDTGPLGSGSAYLDPVGGLHGAAACVTALVHRARHGVGQHVEVAQREAAMHWIGEILLACDRGAPAPVAVGNDRPEGAPHGAYPTRGDDEWVVIDATDDRSFRSLCTLLGEAALADDPRFRTGGERWANRRELDTWLGAATAPWDRHHLASRLQAAGVRAAPVHHGADLAADPHLAANEWFAALDHPDVGRRAYGGLPFVVDGHRLVPRRASPRFGEHNEAVLCGIAGLTSEELAELVDAGVVTDAPTAAR